MIFVGNAIVQLRPDAEWRTFAGQPPTVGSRHRQFELPRMFEHLLGAEDMQRHLTEAILEWAEDTDAGGFGTAPLPAPRPVPGAENQKSYVRPPPLSEPFFAPDGSLIEYGNRWGQDSPPADAYSRESNLERFAGIQDVAHALASYLAGEYGVHVSDDPAHTSDLLRASGDVPPPVSRCCRQFG